VIPERRYLQNRGRRAVDCDTSGIHVVETGDEVCDGGFSRACLADNGDHASFRDGQVKPVKYPLVLIGEVKRDRLNMSTSPMRTRGYFTGLPDHPERKRVAVVGETGSGKTTIANPSPVSTTWIPEVSQSTATDVRDLKISSLRDHIGIVSQTTILFQRHCANNISYGYDNASKEQIIEASKQANAYSFINGRAPYRGFIRLSATRGRSSAAVKNRGFQSPGRSSESSDSDS